METEQVPKEGEAAKAAKKEPSKAAKAAKKLKSEGYHNCTRVQLVRGKNHNIVKEGEEINKIKAMHESNIDEYNGQQINTLKLIKKDGVKYELVDVEVTGRKVPLKMFMEVKK